MSLAAMQHTKSLTNTFVAMAAADRPDSLQALWRFIAMIRDCNWRNWFNCERCGTFTIVKGRGPVTYCGEGLLVALHGICNPKALCGKRLIVVLHNVHGQLPLWQQTCLWQCTHCLWRTCRTQCQHACATGCRMGWYGCRRILQTIAWNFDCCKGVIFFFPCLCLLMLSPLAIWHKEMIVTLLMFASWCRTQSSCWRLAPLQLSMWLIHIDERGWLLLAQSCTLVAINHHHHSLQYNRRKYYPCCSFLQYDLWHWSSRWWSCPFAIVTCFLGGT